MKRLSIIIVTYHSDHDIYDCLSSVWQHCDISTEELEVIIVDNSPECEPMFTKLHQLYGDKILLIHNNHNGGYGQGNNVGIRQASAPVIMVMNPDVRLCEPLFTTALKAFDKDSNLCMYGIKQMLSASVKSPLSFDCTRSLNGYLIPILASFCNRYDIYFPSYMYFAGSCFFINKQKFEVAGLFDEDIFMYGEEDDIHYRIKEKFGASFFYNPHLHYIHQTLNRPMSLATEKKMAESIVLAYDKKNIPVKDTYKNLVRYYRIRLLYANIKKWLGKENTQQQINILEDIIQYLKGQQ